MVSTSGFPPSVFIKVSLWFPLGFPIVLLRFTTSSPISLPRPIKISEACGAPEVLSDVKPKAPPMSPQCSPRCQLMPPMPSRRSPRWSPPMFHPMFPRCSPHAPPHAHTKLPSGSLEVPIDHPRSPRSPRYNLDSIRSL